MRVLLSVAALLPLLGLAPARAAEPEGPDAFVVASVCVDGADVAVPGDPAQCAHRRKLRLGEAVPYRRVDAGNWQALISYPVRGPDGQRRAVAEKIFGGNDTTGSYDDLGARSGYDLIAAADDYVSGIRTSDPGGGDQIFWRTPDCAREGGWIFFPTGLGPGEHGGVRSTLKITKGPSTACPRALLRDIGPDYTTWDRPTGPVRFTSGKRLDTIVSTHYAYADPADPTHNDDSMERFYFTREYGFSRWEAWQTPEGCRARIARGGGDPDSACAPSPAASCNGPNTASFYGKLYLRLDCRDSTFIVAGAEPPFDPLLNDAGPGDVSSRNLLANGTFAAGSEAWEATPAATPRHDERTNNARLALAAGGTLAQGYTATPAETGPGAGGTLRWGATLEGTGGTAHLVLVIEQDGTALRRIEQAVPLGGGPQAARFELPAPGGPFHGRLEIKAGAPDALLVDDAYVAVVPPNAS